MEDDHRRESRWRWPSTAALTRLLYALAALVTALASMFGALKGCGTA